MDSWKMGSVTNPLVCAYPFRLERKRLSSSQGCCSTRWGKVLAKDREILFVGQLICS